MAPTEVPDQAVRALLHRWFPGEAVTFTRMTSGGSTPVYRVEREAQVAYLRLAEHPGEVRGGEVRAHELAIRAGMHVPEIVRWEADPPEIDRSAALTAAMPGILLGEYSGDVLPAAIEAGRQLARLNAIPVTGWGWVDHARDDGGLVAEHTARSTWAGEYLAAVETVAGSAVLPSISVPPLRDAVTRWANRTAGAQSFLAHGDFDGSHIHVDAITGDYQGIIDLGEIRGADRAYDLGHALIHHRPERLIAQGMIAGYRETVPVDDGEIRLQAIAIATRALAINIGREPNAYRAMLADRLAQSLVVSG
ncbi:MAG TPA: phosphotransferase [Thermomicrobiales bacterium]|nr:phosphotransferase [Thermomicrobiales bacterium]